MNTTNIDPSRRQFDYMYSQIEDLQATVDRQRELLERALPLLKTNTFPNKYLIEDVEKELAKVLDANRKR